MQGLGELVGKGTLTIEQGQATEAVDLLGKGKQVSGCDIYFLLLQELHAVKDKLVTV